MLIKLKLIFLSLFIVIGFANAQKSKDTLVYANFRDLRDLNPHLYGGELFAQNLLFESLIKIKNDGSYAPWLAKSYSISKDGKTYTFNLRHDVVFSDGEKFNAKVVKANLDAILQNNKRHGWLESVRLMMKVKNSGQDPVEVLGEYKIKIHLADSYYPFLTELGVTRPFRFISLKSFKKGSTKDGVKSLIGTGPYVLQKNVIDEYSIFVVNKKYWGNKPKIKKIIAKVIPDNQTRLIALENNEIDLIFGTNMIDTETYTKFSNMKGFKTALSNPVSTRMMLLNTTNKILNDVRVRKAIMHATDKEKISKGLFDGLETPATTLFSKKVPYSNIGLVAYDFNFNKANKLLDSAGWKKVSENKYRQKDGKTLEITLNFDSNEVTDKNIAMFLQSQYKKIGIKLKLLGEEEQAYRDRMKSGKFDFTFNISWGVPYDPQSFLGAMRKPVYGDYYAQLGLKNKKMLDDNILKALKSVDERKRQKYYKYVLETLHNEAVYLPLTYERNRAIFNKRIKNLGFNISKFEVPMEKMSIE